jgi:hypothetical protein
VTDLRSETETPFTCPICGKPINLLTDKTTDENGKVMHAECYFERIADSTQPHLSSIPSNDETQLAKTSRVHSETVLRRIADARSLYVDGKYRASLNESRNLIETLIDSISTETDAHGNHSTKLTSGTINRIEYLKNVNFSTFSEQSEFLSVWCSLCGSQHGVSEREQARLGLALAQEFGQLLLLKFSNWKANGHRGFS